VSLAFSGGAKKDSYVNSLQTSIQEGDMRKTKTKFEVPDKEKDLYTSNSYL